MKSNDSGHFIVGIVCAVAALGSSATLAQSKTAPCSLLTQAQVSAVAHVSVGAGQPISTTGCSWTAPHFTATVSLWDATNWDKFKTPLAGMTRTPAAGLGDDAFFSTAGTGKQLTTLTVKKGNTALIFHIYGIDSVSDQMSMEQTLAGEALANW
jgi:hypothetical protein